MRRKSQDTIEFNGEKKSRKEWCRQTGVDPDLAYRRIHYLRWPPTQAVGLEPRVVESYGKQTKIGNRKNVEVTIDGVTRNLLDWHVLTKISYNTLVYRYNHWPKGSNILEPEPQTPTVRMRRRFFETDGSLSQNDSSENPEVWTPADIRYDDAP
jgi:hypothetical protein